MSKWRYSLQTLWAKFTLPVESEPVLMFCSHGTDQICVYYKGVNMAKTQNIKYFRAFFQAHWWHVEIKSSRKTYTWQCDFHLTHTHLIIIDSVAGSTHGRVA